MKQQAPLWEAFLGSDFGVADIQCLNCKKSATYFQDNYFLEKI
jgi:hypothetical protein